MDITFISDTHGLHRELKLQIGTTLVHAGDITEYGTEDEVMDFVDWFSKQPFQYKIFIGGNHDFYLESCTLKQRKKLVGDNIVYLQNSGITIEGLQFWGSPVTPYFLGMAFNARHEEINKFWKKIPVDTDILITHGPPKGILDNGFGCEALLRETMRVKPIVHCFGHIHEQQKIAVQNEITFINASMVSTLNPLQNEEYKIVSKPSTISVNRTQKISSGIENHC